MCGRFFFHVENVKLRVFHSLVDLALWDEVDLVLDEHHGDVPALVLHLYGDDHIDKEDKNKNNTYDKDNKGDNKDYKYDKDSSPLVLDRDL